MGRLKNRITVEERRRQKRQTGMGHTSSLCCSKCVASHVFVNRYLKDYISNYWVVGCFVLGGSLTCTHNPASVIHNYTYLLHPHLSRKPQPFLLEADTCLSPMIPPWTPSQLSQLCVKLYLYICSGTEVGCSPVFYLRRQRLFLWDRFCSGVPAIILLYKSASFYTVFFSLKLVRGP